MALPCSDIPISSDLPSAIHRSTYQFPSCLLSSDALIAQFAFPSVHTLSSSPTILGRFAKDSAYSSISHCPSQLGPVLFLTVPIEFFPASSINLFIWQEFYYFSSPFP
jgi:hypothetical protein